MRAYAHVYVPMPHVLMSARALFGENLGCTTGANTFVCLIYRERARTVATGTQVGTLSNSYSLELVGRVHGIECISQRAVRSWCEKIFEDVCPVVQWCRVAAVPLADESSYTDSGGTS